jgi:CDP-diglyceride synthetase
MLDLLLLSIAIFWLSQLLRQPPPSGDWQERKFILESQTVLAFVLGVRWQVVNNHWSWHFLPAVTVTLGVRFCIRWLHDAQFYQAGLITRLIDILILYILYLATFNEFTGFPCKPYYVGVPMLLSWFTIFFWCYESLCGPSWIVSLSQQAVLSCCLIATFPRYHH